MEGIFVENSSKSLFENLYTVRIANMMIEYADD